eukprot:TRINITY_DN2777_c0_g1_i2.p1 TRINITY_DN2777_c0_g1~~TRINITY_DN2777_c0_g1_i2.p1  ORF type:complete len:275 (+),score=116.30 TRINITY_DN2777_c0_g1_i2:205-1029(+)
MIRQHNMAGHSWHMAMNHFGDLTHEQFKARFLGYRMVRNNIYRAANAAPFHANATIPATVDWVAKGAVTPVKNQQQCGSCWAFSTTGSIEGAWFLAKGKLVSLSEQQLVDCSQAEGNQGCNGGLMDQGFQYVEQNGLCTEDSYPYTAQDGQCASSNCTSVVQISSFKDVAQNNEDALAQAVAQQPVSVAIEADQSGFQFYSGGVFDGQCGTNLDHGVLVVGYGTDSASGELYWKVKNSWGASWGDQGYIKLVRRTGSGQPGQCGIAMQPSYPIV